MEIYMRLKTRDGKLAFEQVNEETFARLMNTTLPTGSNPDFVRPIGPVRFLNGKSIVMITPSGEVFKRA